ncbi:MAG: hypothetical protein LBM38_04285 [Clostridiales bacterium]|jgi:hypothetical protein|nr:hypothetical protein [Clostridiales bacterium]
MKIFNKKNGSQNPKIEIINNGIDQPLGENIEKELLRNADKREDIKMKNAWVALYACFISLGVILLFECITRIAFNTEIDLIANVLEIMKYVTSGIVGYLFSQSKK